jgi:putative membrane protein
MIIKIININSNIMMNGMDNFWGMGSAFGWIIGIIIIVIIFGAVVSVMSRNKNSKQHKYNSPLDILKTRYAKGEISKDEYDEKRRHIS